MRVGWRIGGLLLAAWVTACSRSRAQRPLVRPDPAARTEPVASLDASPTSTPATRVSLLGDCCSVVLERHTPTSPRARYAALTFGDDLARSPRVADLGEVPALELDQWPRHYRTRVTAAQGFLYVASVEGSDASRSWRVDERRMGDPQATPRRIAFGALQPTALHRAGDTLYAGAMGADEAPEVGWFDLDAPSPTYHRLVARGAPGKAYDLFARAEDRLVAIDDVVTPIYADWIELDPRGRPARHEPWELPSFINAPSVRVVVARSPKRGDRRV